MATLFSVFLFAAATTGKDVHIPLNNSVWSVVVLSGAEPGMAVITQGNDGKVLIFDGEAARKGGEPANMLTTQLERATQLFVTETGALAVGTEPSRGPSSPFNGSYVEIYEASTVMHGGGPSAVLSGLGAIDVMTQLPSGDLVVRSSIFGSEALAKGGNATTVLPTKFGYLSQAIAFREGVAYTSSNMEALLIFDGDALASGNDPNPALQIGGSSLPGIPDLHPAKWFIPGLLCACGSVVFEDGTLAVLGTCHGADSAMITLLEDIDFQAQTLTNSSFAMTKGACSMLALPNGYFAVGVTTDYCSQGHVEIFEEGALRSGGEPSFVLQTSGDVSSMAAFQDGRLAVSTIRGGFHGGWCGNSGTIDIFDVGGDISEIAFKFV